MNTQTEKRIQRMKLLNQCGMKRLRVAVSPTKNMTTDYQIRVAIDCLRYGPTYANKIHQVNNSVQIMYKVLRCASDVMCS